MKVSIITALRNEAATIEATIKSVTEQSHADIDYIVIDGKNTDGSAEIIARHAATDPRIRVVSEEDKGVYQAINRGISLAEGEIIGTWQLDCMVVTQVDADGHLLGSDLYEPEYGGGTMYYTFADNGTVTMTMHGMDGTTATDNSTWSLSADGVLCSDLMPNGECWNVNWTTSNTMIISHEELGTEEGDLHYQLQFDAATE